MGTHEDKPVKFVGRHVVSYDGSGAYQTIVLNPLSLDPRLVTVSDAWQNYRFERIHVRAWVGSVSGAISISFPPGSSNLAIGFTTGLLGAAPATQQELASLQDWAMGNGTFGSAYPSLKLGKAALVEPLMLKWMRRGTPFDDNFESQGQFFFLADKAIPYTVCIEYECWFRTPAATGLTAQSMSVDPPTLEELSKQMLEVQLSLGLAGRSRFRLPPPPLEVKQDEEHEDREVDLVVVSKTPVNVAGVRRGSQAPSAPGTPGLMGARARN